jgi:hypothetical protein
MKHYLGLRRRQEREWLIRFKRKGNAGYGFYVWYFSVVKSFIHEEEYYIIHFVFIQLRRWYRWVEQTWLQIQYQLMETVASERDCKYSTSWWKLLQVSGIANTVPTDGNCCKWAWLQIQYQLMETVASERDCKYSTSWWKLMQVSVIENTVPVDGNCCKWAWLQIQYQLMEPIASERDCKYNASWWKLLQVSHHRISVCVWTNSVSEWIC